MLGIFREFIERNITGDKYKFHVRRKSGKVFMPDRQKIRY
jgi:hypothetical protein